jgi:hypothetical protein
MTWSRSRRMSPVIASKQTVNLTLLRMFTVNAGKARIITLNLHVIILSPNPCSYRNLSRSINNSFLSPRFIVIAITVNPGFPRLHQPWHCVETVSAKNANSGAKTIHTYRSLSPSIPSNPPSLRSFRESASRHRCSVSGREFVA